MKDRRLKFWNFEVFSNFGVSSLQIPTKKGKTLSFDQQISP
jgi:hypothetical protein